MSTNDQEPNRRDFLYIATGAAGAVGVGAAAWPFIDQMNPDASALALASIEIDVSSLEPGMSLRALWRGKPVFIRNLTADELKTEEEVSLGDLIDDNARSANDDGLEATAANRIVSQGDKNLAIMVGVCTHLGCVPVSDRGDFEGWFCPCHGSHYDRAGRIRKGPAPENLPIPEFAFISDDVVKIG